MGGASEPTAQVSTHFALSMLLVVFNFAAAAGAAAAPAAAVGGASEPAAQVRREHVLNVSVMGRRMKACKADKQAFQQQQQQQQQQPACHACMLRFLQQVRNGGRCRRACCPGEHSLCVEHVAGGLQLRSSSSSSSSCAVSKWCSCQPRSFLLSSTVCRSPEPYAIMMTFPAANRNAGIPWL
jgi:hypothetical protein